MRLNFNMQMLERMSEGVVLLNRQAQVVAHNAASGAWTSLCKEKGAALKMLIDQAVSGRVELPAKLNLFARNQANGVPAADAWLCKNGLQDFALFLSPHETPMPDQAVTEKHYVSLLGEEVRGQMQQLRTLLQGGASGTPQDADAIAAQSVYVDTLLEQVSDLSMLLQRTQPFGDERIEIDLLIQDLLPQMQRRCNNQFAYKPGGVKHGVLYGNAVWLSYALSALLVELGESAPPESEIVVTMHQMGGFLVLTGDVAVPYGMRQAPQVRGTTQEARKAASKTVDGARMLMAKRIIELHAGKLKINFLQQDAPAPEVEPVIGSFTLTIPTGVSSQQPAHSGCSECPIALQAQIYASDMAILLAGK